MENKLLKKLQIKPGYCVSIINEQHSVNFGVVPTDVSFNNQFISSADAFFIFATNRKELYQQLEKVAPSINEKTICWLIYPKSKSGIATDLNLMQNWEGLKNYKVEPCASAAIDETWTALRVRKEGQSKKSGLANEDIQKSEYGDYIDVTSKTVRLPPYLLEALTTHPTALSFFESLSYSNKKEYVLWILSAKQEKTRDERIGKTVEKLLSGKKNPSEK
ncbi:YdeI/OmpD-associated family protein [Pedobacter montanisoli]|uniref:YdeI/OmpD-associated family protein n=1 Tax=Pedobacter montanisoli TaxID=2923277 RepID=A0ABS9ZY73_9SPHI|nr:YdeI/OmpD-associated family protein [Pedobacter montanisoli]MCJ0743234.1 YdeI/OmpD-associated family protein [Pedobacter montanisoli]